MAKGLEHCHDNLIAHLDIKPANILITSMGQCKLADFGCSQNLNTEDEQKPVECDTVGTPGYQAPEMFKLKVVQLKCDIFSLGILMWQLLAKEIDTFPGAHPHTIIFKMVSKDCRPIKGTDKTWKTYESLYKACWDKVKKFRTYALSMSVRTSLCTLLRIHCT